MPAVMSKCAALINPSKKKDEADPYIIAAAISKKLVVVTQEIGLGESSQRMKIPDVCRVFDLECVNLVGLIRQIGWAF